MDAIEASHQELIERVSAREGLRPESIAPLSSMATGEPIGEVQVLSGVNVDKAVSVELRLDDDEQPCWTRGFYVFAKSLALVPHLAIEWSGLVRDGEARLHLLVDLLPRIDLAVNLDYVDEVYGPLASVYEAVPDIEGVAREGVPPRRAVAMSPWRVSVSTPEDSAKELAAVAEGYLDRWITVNTGGVGSPVDPLASDQARLIQHDRFHRNALFDAASDPYWQRVDRLLGIDPAAELRMTLRSQRER